MGLKTPEEIQQDKIGEKTAINFESDSEKS